MRDKAVLDSSFIASMFFLDDFTEWARKRVVKFRDLVTLNYARIEIFNVAWKRISLFNGDEKVVKVALKKAMEFIDTLEVFNAEKFLDSALDIGLQRRISIYDSLFIATALKLDCLLLTTDLKLASKIREMNEIESIILAPI